MNRIRETISAIAWSLRLALRINAKICLTWGILSLAAAILPSMALQFNRRAVSILSAFLQSGSGTFGDIVPTLVSLGILLTAIGLSKRINADFLYFIMYDAYYYGMEEYLMDSVHTMPLKALMDSDTMDAFAASTSRCGSLTDFMSAGLFFVSKLVGVCSLLIVAAQASAAVFGFSALYVLAILLLNILGADKLRWDARPFAQKERLTQYYEQAVLTPGVAKEIRIYQHGEAMAAQWGRAHEAVMRLDIKRRGYVRMASFLSGMGFFLFLAAMMGYSVLRVAQGHMTVDIFLMLYAMGQSLSDLLEALSSSLLEADRGLYFLSIQRQFIGTMPRESGDWAEGFQPQDEQVVFAAKDLCFSYDDIHEALHGLCFEIRKGETIALVGPNGSGKTTLVKLLIGLFQPTAGTLRFYGAPYDEKTKGAVIRRVGMFFQDFYIYHASLRENIGFGDVKRLNDEGRVLEALEKGGARLLLDRLPKGLEHWLQRNVRKDGALLSGGEKQRVAVARAHMSDKEVLILDEPAAALDPVAEMEQFHAIREKIAGRTAILISHRVGFARLADRIFVLDGGALKQVGTHDELLRSGGIYADFFHEQAQWYDVEGGGPQRAPASAPTRPMGGKTDEQM